MANTFNNAEKYERELIQSYVDKSYIAPFVSTNTEFIDAKNFHFTVLTTSGYKNHSLNGGWNRGEITETDKVYTLTQDRDIEFLIDKRNVDETNQTASIKNISKTFEEENATPEKDAYFFSKVAKVAKEAGKETKTARASYTAENIYSKIVNFISGVKRYRNKGLIVYLDSDLMDLLSLSKELNHNVEVTTIAANDGKAIQTRITQVDNTPIVEVIDDDRFYSKFDFTEGFAPASDGKKINMLAATPLTTKMVPKIESIYMFAPGQHTEGDGYLYQNRAHYDTFVFPNGKNGLVDSVAVDIDDTAVSL